VTIKLGDVITKEWEVENDGTETWVKRRLVAIGTPTGLVPIGHGQVLSRDGRSTTIKPSTATQRSLALYRAKLKAKKRGIFTVLYKQQKLVNGKWVEALPGQDGVWVTVRIQ